MEENLTNFTSSSSSVHDHDHNRNISSSSDEISVFLRQLLVRSSSSLQRPSTVEDHMAPHAPPRFITSAPCIPTRSVVSAVDLTDGVSSGFSAVWTSGNETDEYDYESEEGLEAVVDETPTKAAPPRGSSKRSRAAEVHNMSEKRRRSRINEKMKALQNLIPNSNKTDKASMLDEAIEYLKQLQLQVQMLSMRNGLSSHSMCLPGVFQPTPRTGFGEEMMNINRMLPENTDLASQTVYNLHHQRASANNVSAPSNMSDIINSDITFGLESSTQSQFGPFQLVSSSEETCREKQPHVTTTSSSTEFKTFQDGYIRMQTGKCTASDDIKLERLGF